MTVYEQDWFNSQTALFLSLAQYYLIRAYCVAQKRLLTVNLITCVFMCYHTIFIFFWCCSYCRVLSYVFFLMRCFCCRWGMTVYEQDWLNWQAALFPPRAQYYLIRAYCVAQKRLATVNFIACVLMWYRTCYFVLNALFLL